MRICDGVVTVKCLIALCVNAMVFSTRVAASEVDPSDYGFCTNATPGVKVRCVDEWGFELLDQFDQRIRPEGIRPGDVIKILLTSRPEKHRMQGVDGRE